MSPRICLRARGAISVNQLRGDVEVNTNQLSKIIAEISSADPDRFTMDELVNWVAGLVQKNAEVEEVQIRTVMASGEASPSPDDTLFGGQIDELAEQSPSKVSSFTLFGKPPVLGNLCPVMSFAVQGPWSGGGPMRLKADEHGLVLRICTIGTISWVLARRNAPFSKKDEEEWGQFMLGLLGITLHHLVPLDPASVRGCRHTFFKDLLECHPFVDSVEERFKQICEAWLSVTNATTASLWLYNPVSDQLDLARVVGSQPDFSTEKFIPPQYRTLKLGNGVTAYCAKRHKSEYIRDLPNWHREYKGVVYRLGMKLDDLKIPPALEFVPLFDSNNGERVYHLGIVGVMLLTYSDTKQRIPHADQALLTMGGVTALLIRKSQDAEQRLILLKLNALAQEHLATISRRPDEVRSKYLGEIIALVETRLRMGCVSIWYRTPLNDGVHCLATTGICDKNKTPIPPDRIAECIYFADQGFTGMCYTRNEIMMRPNWQKIPGHIGKYPETRRVQPTQDLDPILLVPIPSVVPGREKPALGVIRCIEHTSPVFTDALSTFDPIDVETLQFIAAQIGPVLQTFEQRIDRERTVNVVKHDLQSPLGMVCDKSVLLLNRVRNGLAVREHDLLDICMCGEIGKRLVEQLDRDPALLGEQFREPTYLEAHIIAPLNNMMKHYARAAKGMSIVFEEMRHIPLLMIDRHEIDRVIGNLITNAVKYGEKNTEIHVAARITNEYYVVDVSNKGIGIEPDEMQHLFTPYYRSPRARAHSMQGVGLGLAISRQIMKAYDGDIILTSPKNPTVFSIMFPRSLAISEEGRHER